MLCDCAFSNNSDLLIITFTGSILPKDRMEWSNALSEKYKHLIFNKMYIADENVAWYQGRFKNIKGYGPFALRDYIAKKIPKHVNRIATMGLSMGGYGAVLFGCLLGAEVSVAYSPQTFLDEHRYRKNNLHKKFEGLCIDEQNTDLKNVIERSSKTTIHHVYYGYFFDRDAMHAERIGSSSNVILHPIKSATHTVAKQLIKNGTVEKILVNIINGTYRW